MKIELQPAEVVRVQVPFRFVKRGGRKEMVLPEGVSQKSPSAANTLIKALARAFRWKMMLESGEFGTISDLAAHEKIAPTYMTRILRLTLLAPGIVEGMLEGQRVSGLVELMQPLPADWAAQLRNFSPVRRSESRGS